MKAFQEVIQQDVYNGKHQVPATKILLRMQRLGYLLRGFRKASADDRVQRDFL